MKLPYTHRDVPSVLSTTEGATSRWLQTGHRTKRIRERPTRVFVHEAGETVLEGFVKRESRPIALWREFVTAGLAQMFGPHDCTLRWDRHAGCSMCPCSPGFYLVRNGVRQAVTSDGIVNFATLDPETPRFDLKVEIGTKVTTYDNVADARAQQLHGKVLTPATN